MTPESFEWFYNNNYIKNCHIAKDLNTRRRPEEVLQLRDELQHPLLLSEGQREVTENVSVNVTVSPATTSVWFTLPPATAPLHQFYELWAHVWPLMDRGLCLSVCLFVCVSAWLGGWKQGSWFPRSLSALFCANIWKYFTRMFVQNYQLWPHVWLSVFL